MVIKHALSSGLHASAAPKGRTDLLLAFTLFVATAALGGWWATRNPAADGQHRACPIDLLLRGGM